MTTHREPRSLFVVSDDYDELSLVMTVLRGQALTRQAEILLPDTLFAVHRDKLPAPAAGYQTADNILARVDAHKPDVVFLCSAYLLSIRKQLPPDVVDALVGRLHEQGRRVVTSDPLLGLAPRLTAADVDGRMLGQRLTPFRRRLVRLALRLVGRRRTILRVPRLEGVVHLYPTSVPPGDHGTRRVAFFNPAVIRPARPAAVQGSAPERQPGWLFVLTNADLHVQLLEIGLREFVECLLGLLRQAAEAGKPATLIAPPMIVELLAGARPAGVELLPSCPVTELEERVLEAEYAFFWNAFSPPHLLRTANALPVFLFDRGYFARTARPFYDLARTCHFGGQEPAYLDQRQLFNDYVLAHLAKAQGPTMRALREHWQSSPAPDHLVAQLLAAP